jgi:hypothetical protein
MSSWFTKSGVQFSLLKAHFLCDTRYRLFVGLEHLSYGIDKRLGVICYQPSPGRDKLSVMLCEN